MGNWQEKKLCELLVQRKEQVIIDPDFEYSLVTISKKGEVKLRERKKGALISAQKGYITKSGDFIYSRLSVHTGAFGIVPQELDNALITNEMPCFEIDKTQILPEILVKSIGLSDFLWQLKQLTKGMGRVRIKESMMLSLSLILPSIKEQRKIVAHFKNVETEDAELKTELTHQQTLLKKLRQQILQEAIEGKLTADWREQNTEIEPASALLARIQAEKAQLIKDKKIKKQKPLAPISEDEKPFALPDGWVWCRLGDYALFERGKFSIRPRNDSSCFGGKYPFIQIGSLDEFGSVVSTYNQTLNEKGYSASKLFEQGTLMIAIVGGTIGNLGVLGKDMCFPDSMVGVRPRGSSNEDYILMLLRHFQPYIRELSYQMAGQPNIKLPTLNNLISALPPLSEQNAIVAKVEKLLDLCDQLESQISHNQNHAEQLMQAVLKEAFTSEATEQVAANA